MDAPAPPNSDNSDASPHVAALVVTRRPGDLGDVVSAIQAQVYEAKSISVISTDTAHSKLGSGIKSFASVAEVLRQLSADVAFVWIVDQDARPRPEALAALVSTAGQIDASVVGSKILRADQPQELISVGEATDIFGSPYSGLEAGELDQEQYDVIRDVAYVESASMLVRRDLAIGLGGLDPLVPYLASGLDFCQRARLAGGRVVVAPTSEVLYEGFRGDRSQTWREQAGRIRSMLKVYEGVTLLWAMPVLLLIGLITAIYWSFNARPFALVDWGRAWLWNVVHLGSTTAERARARRSRQADDGELFRYQIKGSVELRGLAAQFGSIIQDDADEDEQDLEQLFNQGVAVWHRPALVASIFGLIYVAALTRSLWADGMPSVGFTLPLADHAYDVLRAYAGGWNLGGLGSGQPMPPAVGATAVVQFVTRFSAPMAATGMTVGASALAIVGVVRLLRRLGIGQIPRYAASVIIVAGPAAAAIGSLAYWPALLAMGTLPWALAAVVEPLPATLRSRLGRLARIALAVGWAAAMVPPLVVLPAIFGLVWAVARKNLRSAGRGLLVSSLGIPFLFPWLAAQDLMSIFTGGEPIRFDLSWLSIAGILVAGSAVLFAAAGAALRTGGLGAILAALGAFVARSGSLGSGLDLTVVGALTAGIGFALRSE
ncbi:MAG TPA: glycosyltransferase family 2 protein, partial [Actinobacteria bacterium]|nr:glycosyltransferase family 2 protein [Actinomycetota bacterium]